MANVYDLENDLLIFYFIFVLNQIAQLIHFEVWWNVQKTRKTSHQPPPLTSLGYSSGNGSGAPFSPSQKMAEAKASQWIRTMKSYEKKKKKKTLLTFHEILVGS